LPGGSSPAVDGTLVFRAQENIPNSGEYVIKPIAFEDRDNTPNLDLTFGFLQIQLSNPTTYFGISISP